MIIILFKGGGGKLGNQVKRANAPPRIRSPVIVYVDYRMVMYVGNGGQTRGDLGRLGKTWLTFRRRRATITKG